MKRYKTKMEKQQELQMIGSSKEERAKFQFEYRKNNFTSFDSNLLDNIHPRNKKLLINFMTYLAYSDMAKKTCQNIKLNLTLFFEWNMIYNNNITFRMVTKTQGESFFLFVKEMGYTYTRAKCMKTDICSLADYAEFILGKDEYNFDGTSNQWFSYHHRWRDVDIQQKEEDEYGFRKYNADSFDIQRLDTLRFYLQSNKDYMGLIILEYCSLKSDILLLKETDDIFNRNSQTGKKYLKWKKKVGAEDIPDVLISRRPDGTYVPMSLSELRRYTKMFSIFLGKEFIIC